VGIRPAAVGAVVFDLGGVLFDWNPRHLYRRVFDGDEIAMERFLAAVCTPAWNLGLDRGRSFEEAIGTLRQEHPAEAERITAYRERWIEMIGGTIPGTPEILEELDAAGVPLYALSNIARESFDKLRAKFPLMQRFRGALVSGDERVIKPDPRIFQLLAERFTLTPERALFIDDVAENVAGAESVGFLGHHFTGAMGLRGRLRELGLPVG
jgi:2-haloacid dehalogenase